MGNIDYILEFSDLPAAVSFVEGASILQVAQQNDVEINATCGGRGRCRSCRVKMIKGTPPNATICDRSQLSDEEIREGFRLACQCFLKSDASIAIAPPVNETLFQILVDSGIPATGGKVMEPDSGVSKTFLLPERNSTGSGRNSEIEELLGGTETSSGASLTVVRQIPKLLKNLNDGITVTRFGGQVISIEPGDTVARMFGLAFDIGSTTVVGYLADLNTGETISSVSGLNPQSVFGGDLISRIAFGAEIPANVRKLHSKIVTYLNDLSKELCSQAGIEPDHVYKVTVVGNTCMHHLFLGIEPTSVGHAPYLPVIRGAYSCSAREAGLRLNRDARMFMLPLVAGFVGADTVGVILSTGICNHQGISVVADIGTNAEVVLKCPDGLFACSSPAGPALEGGQIHDGMRAALGAIDQVTIDDDIGVHTIGNVPALGICGSGLIDIIAVLLEVGIIMPSGRLLLAPKNKLSKRLARRLRNGPGGQPEFVLVWAKDSANHNDIVLTQGDIRQFQLAKAAILGGVVALAERAGVACEDISRFMLAGGFGNFLVIKNARRVGLIPDLETKRIQYVSNAAGLGAQMALISERERIRAGQLAETVIHISLAGFAGFQKMYLDAMAFPKTTSEKS
ncbi:MAG: DUF4445 domain-containing protein [Hyphomicrobiales bacterium]|nr:DUF4445 domain-containing protein [Hyphomicrobiales bacterium]